MISGWAGPTECNDAVTYARARVCTHTPFFPSGPNFRIRPGEEEGEGGKQRAEREA